MTITLPIDAEANKLLSTDPLALLVGMVLDQQVPLEKAFSSPYVLAQRLGHAPTARELAEFDGDALIEIFATPPALHRFPKAMATRVQDVCRVLVAEYDGDAANLWADVRDGAELLRRVGSLPGFGKQKAQIFTALLGKQYGVQPDGWREAAGAYGEQGSYRSVADIVDDDSLTRVRAYKKEMKAAAKRAD
ncbi:HhH-GPD-type base excision DNA repair protein [Krasilnikovia sp. MM14-A1004]|uniref:HhH-GPD-type base excision DNA repair protein n=1 Tax=Krasilnikovia sp. MM14-A1004 TaxID=3373541 RepID=UPI00399D53AB